MDRLKLMMAQRQVQTSAKPSTKRSSSKPTGGAPKGNGNGAGLGIWPSVAEPAFDDGGG